MQLEVVNLDSKTLASVLSVCANMAALEQGMEIHERIIRNGFLSDGCVVNALDVWRNVEASRRHVSLTRCIKET